MSVLISDRCGTNKASLFWYDQPHSYLYCNTPHNSPQGLPVRIQTPCSLCMQTVLVLKTENKLHLSITLVKHKFRKLLLYENQNVFFFVVNNKIVMLENVALTYGVSTIFKNLLQVSSILHSSINNVSFYTCIYIIWHLMKRSIIMNYYQQVP